ncbi:MAG TPA: ATP-binding protein [Pseudonocardiaceae bacterium]|nr:ATP-binding protein [Pseudonocardiaceae bacterium]
MPGEAVEQVFKTTGVPTHTFVRPVEFDRLTIALRAPGRGAVIEGPSGIGKTTAVAKALEVLGVQQSVTALSGRRRDHADHIAALSADSDFGTVVIDDFHRLDESVRARVADLLKLLADADEPHRKIVIVGINKAGDSLVSFAPDLVNRIDVIPFDVEPTDKVADLVDRGCAALGVRMAARDSIVTEAAGSFCLAQLFCLEACVQAGYLDSAAGPSVIDTSFEPIRQQVLARQAARFGRVLRDFARGVTFHPDGRAPFVHLLRWLIDADGWSISLRDRSLDTPASGRASVRCSTRACWAS